MSYAARLSASTLGRCTRLSSCRVALAPIRIYTQPLQLRSKKLFSSSSYILNKQADELKDAITSELKYEQRDLMELEKFHEEWLNSSGFKIVEKNPKEVGSELVKETETDIIHVYFNPLEVTNFPLESDFLKTPPPEDNAHNFEEEENTQSLLSLTEDVFASVTVIIEKKGSTAGLYINLALSVQTKFFATEGLKTFENIKDAMKNSAEDEFKRVSAYYGPPFTTLDDLLQESLMAYLTSRGIDNSLGDFICGYSLVKENNLYLAWLEGLKGYFEN